ncbi:hypothetical protein NKR23_g2521 [Pleurostoma richardsiae]|uniref:Ankyrin n=1 Tax=Pleurostoma richardsiae TaxID=41990 RepID=A0AA38VV68_9PEZI|nr:hypothetical protein NKR23_g2521 [Pleurostoma richardsiae]
MALSAPQYAEFEPPEECGERYCYLSYDHLARVIQLDDVAALREFIQLKPGLIAWTDVLFDAYLQPAPMDLAASMGRNACLRVLLDHEASLRPGAKGLSGQKSDKFRRNALVAACATGQLSTVQLLLDLQPPIDIQRPGDYVLYDFTPLLSVVACQEPWSDTRSRLPWTGERDTIVRLLLDRGADARAACYSEGDGGEPAIKDTTLTLAMPSANPWVVRWLVDAGANPRAKTQNEWTGRDNVTPLHIGLFSGNVAGVKALLEFSTPDDLLIADSDGELPLHSACRGRSNSTELFDRLLADHGVREATINAPNKRGHTPLHCAVSWHKPEAIPVLLRYGADYSAQDVNGRTPLSLLLSDPMVEHPEPEERDEAHAILSKFLNFFFADHVIRDVLINTADRSGYTPLHLAARAPCSWLIQRLLENGADPNRCASDGRTPLHTLLASTPDKYSDHTGFETDVEEGLICLLEDEGIRKATINAQDSRGYTPLHLAACFVRVGHRIPLVRALLDRGADVKALDGEGRTPLHALCAGVTRHDGPELENEVDDDLIRRLLGLPASAT